MYLITRIYPCAVDSDSTDRDFRYYCQTQRRIPALMKVHHLTYSELVRSGPILIFPKIHFDIFVSKRAHCSSFS